MLTMISILVWLLLGLWGYHIAYNTYIEIMKTGWWNERRIYMPFLILLGPLNLIGQIITAYMFKRYWYSVWKVGTGTGIRR